MKINILALELINIPVIQSHKQGSVVEKTVDIAPFLEFPCLLDTYYILQKFIVIVVERIIIIFEVCHEGQKGRKKVFVCVF